MARETGAAAPPIHAEADLDQAIDALRRLDPGFVDHLLAVGGRPPLRRRPAGLEGLAAIVLGQQVSTASAAAMVQKLGKAISPFDAATLKAASDDVLRACGLSAAKMRTLRAVAAAMEAGALPFESMAERPFEAAEAALLAIPGIGPWTADIFLLTCLGHADAWPAGDLALQEAARMVLGLDARPTAAQMVEIGARWRPLRAVAARLLWSYYRAVKQGRDGMLFAQTAARIVPPDA